MRLDDYLELAFGMRQILIMSHHVYLRTTWMIQFVLCVGEVNKEYGQGLPPPNRTKSDGVDTRGVIW